MSEFKGFLLSTCDELGRRLAPHGFAREPITQKLYKVHNFYRVREAGWRNDTVRLFYRWGTDNLFNLDLGVYLPVEGRDEAAAASPVGTHLDGANLEWLVGRKKPYYLLKFIGRLWVSRATSFARKMGRDVERSLDWFEDYRRPQDCLRKLEARDTVWGNARGDAYHALSEHLKEASNGASAPTVPG